MDEIDTDQIKETLDAFPESSIYLEIRGLANVSTVITALVPQYRDMSYSTAVLVRLAIGRV